PRARSTSRDRGAPALIGPPWPAERSASAPPGPDSPFARATARLPQPVPIGAGRLVLIGHVGVAHERFELEVGEEDARGGRGVPAASQRVDREDAALEEPDLAHAESLVDAQLADGAARDDDLDRQIGETAQRAAERVALVGLDGGFLLGPTERHLAVAVDGHV